MKSNYNLSLLIKDKILTLFFILTLLYIGLCTPVRRYTWYFLNKKEIEVINSHIFSLNNTLYENLQEKFLLDLTYHKLKTPLFPETIIKLSLTDEGKVLGYRYYTTFYPTYFTQKQAKKITDKEYVINKKKTTFHIVKVSYH
jgi:hypothetical protein